MTVRRTPGQLARGRAESAYHVGRGAPKFYCQFCGRDGQGLRHIAACAKRSRKEAHA